MRINIPTLTQEGRRDLTKHLHKLAEEFKVSIRNHRRDANDKIKKFEKDGDVTKDEAKRGQDQIQKQTDEHITQIEQILKAKEAEILEV